MTVPQSVETEPDARQPHKGISLGRWVRKIRPAWRMPLLVFAWAQLVLLVWWAGQYPGLLSADSVRYVIHVTDGPWVSDHSVLYDTIVLASLKLTHSVGLLTAVQTTAAAGVLAYTAASLHAFGVRARWAAVPALVMPLIPSVGTFFTTVWKDVPFAMCEVLIAATTARLILHRRNAPEGSKSPRGLIVALGAEFLGLVLFRNDGFLMLTVAVVVLAITLTGERIKILAVGAGALVGFALAHSVVYPAAGIKPPAASLSYGLFYADIALAYAEAPRTFTAADRGTMTKAAPLSTWRSADNCYSSDPLFRRKNFSTVKADQEHAALFSLWTLVLKRTPITVLRARMCRGSVAWNPIPSPVKRTSFGMLVPEVPGNLYHPDIDSLMPPDVAKNLTPHPLNRSLGHFLYSVRVHSIDSRALQSVIWRGSTWCYVAYLLVGFAAWRLRRRSVLAIGGICLANQLTVMAANPAQLYRYMVGPILVGMLLLPLVSIRSPRRDLAPEPDEPDTRTRPDPVRAPDAPRTGLVEAVASGSNGH